MKEPKVAKDIDLGNYGEGLWVFEKDNLFGFMKENGEIAIKPQFGYADTFHEGFAFVHDDNHEKKFFIDKTGKNAYRKTFTDAHHFSDGLAPVSIGEYDEREGHNKDWGYINQKGILVIEPKFEDAEPFSEGLAAVKVNKKWGYINNKGQLVINAQFNYAYKFMDGKARVETGKGWKLIDKQGKTCEGFVSPVYTINNKQYIIVKTR